MECSTETNTTATTTTTTTTTTSATCRSGSQSPSSSSSPPSTPNPNPSPSPSPPVVISPCAACKILRRRCADKCVLAPYFPPTDPAKFTIAHRVFGASNIIKFLQELPESQRADAVSSMVYEASARIRDPVYGCAGAICQLQKQVSELQAQLAKAQAEVVNMQCQQANLMALICMDLAQSQQVYYDSPLNHHINPQPQQQQQQQQALDGSIFNNMITTTPSLMITNNQSNNGLSFLEDNNNILGSMWEPLWT